MTINKSASGVTVCATVCLSVCLSVWSVMCVQYAHAQPATCHGCILFGRDQSSSRTEPEDKEAPVCQYPCRCPHQALQCHQGQGEVTDGCGCCRMCGRQLGDLCNLRDRCDSSKDLVCDRNTRDDRSIGYCRAPAITKRKSCLVDGILYKDGEVFSPQCSRECTCQNGFYGCVNQCPQEAWENRPSELTCHEPKLQPVVNHCCKEWTCQKLVADGSNPLGSLESQALVNGQWVPTTVAPPTIPGPAHNCHKASTDWSPCSVTCDVGVAVRHIVDDVTCQAVQERKLCYLRPCGKNITTIGRDKCTPTTRNTESRVHVRYQDCLSVKEYKLKFCTTCMEDKCCWPQKTHTASMEFECSGGKRKTFNYMFIKWCRCDSQCFKRDKKVRTKRQRMRRQQQIARRREKRRKRKLLKKKQKADRKKKQLHRKRSKRRKSSVNQQPAWLQEYLKTFVNKQTA